MEGSLMHNLADMIWVELRKAIRSRLPLWTALGSLFMPLGIAFLIFVAKNPDFSQKLGLISAKANLIAYASTDWQAYLGLFGEIVAAGGFILFVLVISWVFGREFADGTLKDMLAVPVPRSTILLSKFMVVALWSAMLTAVIYVVGLFVGALLKLPGGSFDVIWRESGLLVVSACLAIAVVLPFALFASVGRGYLLPFGVAILMLMMGNLVEVVGWGEYFPWAVPELYSQGDGALTAASYTIVLMTGLAGVLATYLWWQLADQSR
jgi:ABC-2 type transport system permease protein